MKTENLTSRDEEALQPTRHLAAPKPSRRLPPSIDDCPPPKRKSFAAEIIARLDRLAQRNRFYGPVDLTPLAAAWAADYVDQVFPDSKGNDRNRMLLAAEAGFLATIELKKNGMSRWGPLLAQAIVARDQLFQVK